MNVNDSESGNEQIDSSDEKIPIELRKYYKYSEFSRSEKRNTFSENNAYYEEIRKKGETSSEDEIEIRRELANEDGETRKDLDENLLRFKQKFQRAIKKPKKTEQVIAEYGDLKMVKKPHPLKEIEDLRKSDFSATEEDIKTHSDSDLNEIKSDGSNDEIAPHLNDRMRRTAFERIQYGDFSLREEIYKDAPFHEKPLEIQHSSILQETQKLIPKRESEFLNYYDSSRRSKINLDQLFENFFGENYYPNKLENFLKDQFELDNQKNATSESEKETADELAFFSPQQQSEYAFELESLFYNYTKKATNFQLGQLEAFTGRKASSEEYNQIMRRVVNLGEEMTDEIPKKLDSKSHLEALKDQYIHALDLAFQKVKEFNPTIEKEEIDDSNYLPQFDREMVVAEAIQNVEELEFDRQWEAVQSLRRGRLPHYLNFYLSLFDLRFRKFYPERARKWIEFAKTPRGYFGRDAQWHTMTKKEFQRLKIASKPTPTQHTELFQPHDPTIEADLLKGYRFGFLQSEIDSFENLSPKLKDLLSLQYAYPSEIKKFRIYNQVNLWKRHPLDTGSPEIQVAVFTIRMDLMLKHLFKNKKDFPTKLALQKLTTRRKTMMTYLKKKNVRRYFEVLYHLKLPDIGDFHWNTSWPN
jgi:ribosomal protein S15